jgi:hypothetical protein
MPRAQDFFRSELSALKSSGTSPNFRSSLAPPTAPVAKILAAAERDGEALDGVARCDAVIGRDGRESDVTSAAQDPDVNPTWRRQTSRSA